MSGKVILKQENEETESEMGIVISTEKEQHTSYGEVVAVADGASLTVGSRVLFNKFMGDEVEDDNEKFVVVPESEVLCIIK